MTAISDTLLSGIEVIDAESDVVINALSMGLADVLSMSDTTNDLFIIGGTNDTVALSPSFILGSTGQLFVGDSHA